MALVVAPVATPILSKSEILDLAVRRQREFRARDALYDVLGLYYYGRDLSDQTVNVLAMNSQGRPLLRDLERYKEASRIYSSQRLAPIVDDYQALVGRMPSTRVEPPDSSTAGEAKAELLTKYLISTQELSDMDRQQAEAGFHMPAYGDACYLLEVDSTLRRVVWSVVDPRSAFPSFYRGYKRYQVADLIVRTIDDPDSIKRTYGFMPRTADKNDCTVTIYTSQYQRTVVVGVDRAVVGPHVEWNLPFCPAQWVFNKVNGAFGQSDIAQSLGQQDFMDFAYNILIDGLVRNVYGTIISIRNPQQTGQEPIVLGPNPPPIYVEENGGVTATQVGGDIAPAMQMIQQTIGDINASTGTSQVRQEGQMHGSIQTGRAIHAAQGPQSTRIDLKQENLGASIRRLNAMTLEMQEKAPHLGTREIEIWGRYKGRSFTEKLSGKDIDGWYRNTVMWDALIGLNLQQREQIATQGVISGLWDDFRARELVGVEDPIGMRDRVKAMKLYQAEVEAEVQRTMQGAMGGQPPAGGQGAPGGGAPSSLGGPGGQAQPPSGPPQIMRPPGLAQLGANGQPPGLPTGVPQGISRKAVESTLAAVADKLKGTVWAVGELALTGQSLRPQLIVSDWKDQPLVMQSLKPLIPTVKVNAGQEKDLPEGAVRVA